MKKKIKILFQLIILKRTSKVLMKEVRIDLWHVACCFFSSFLNPVSVGRWWRRDEKYNWKKIHLQHEKLQKKKATTEGWEIKKFFIIQRSWKDVSSAPRRVCVCAKERFINFVLMNFKYPEFIESINDTSDKHIPHRHLVMMQKKSNFDGKVCRKEGLTFAMLCYWCFCVVVVSTYTFVVVFLFAFCDFLKSLTSSKIFISFSHSQWSYLQGILVSRFEIDSKLTSVL